MIIKILSQGLSEEIENSVGAALIENLRSKRYFSFTAISAFASESGINGLSEHIEVAKEAFGDRLTIIVGVDQKATSKEALEALVSLEINAYIFYHTGYTIFHPKVYLFEGEQISLLIVGSSNLTTQGLFTNIETSLQIELDMGEENDRELLAKIKAQFETLFNLSDPNLKPITNELIADLVDEKIVPTEEERKEIQKKAEEFGSLEGEPVERKVRILFPKRSLPVAPKEFRRGKKRKAGSEGETSIHPQPAELVEEYLEEKDVEKRYVLVWCRKQLPASSVEISTSAKTNPTGGLRLVQDKFLVDGQVIDQTTYFRNDVFGKLSWIKEKTSPLVETAIATFWVIVLGEDLGRHNLEVRHKPSGEAGQHNYTTSISWGVLSKEIRARNLIDYKLNLYRNSIDSVFKLEIL